MGDISFGEFLKSITQESACRMDGTSTVNRQSATNDEGVAFKVGQYVHVPSRYDPVQIRSIQEKRTERGKEVYVTYDNSEFDSTVMLSDQLIVPLSKVTPDFSIDDYIESEELKSDLLATIIIANPAVGLALRDTTHFLEGRVLGEGAASLDDAFVIASLVYSVETTELNARNPQKTFLGSEVTIAPAVKAAWAGIKTYFGV